MYKDSNIIAINGTIGSGKNTFSNVFEDNGYISLSFASVLKDVLSVLFSWDREMLEGLTPEHRKIRDEQDIYWSNKLETFISPRRMLQEIGTELFKNRFNSSIWIYTVDKKIDEYYKNGERNFIITDCRFFDEINYLKSIKATFFEIQKDKPVYYDYAYYYNKINRGYTYNIDEFNYYKSVEDFSTEISPSYKYNIHSSEWSWIGLNEPDYFIVNDGTVLDLEDKAKAYLRNL